MRTNPTPSNTFVRLVMFASRAPFWGGSALMFVMLAPGVIFGVGVAILLSSLIVFVRAGEFAWVISDAPTMFPDQPRLAILAGLPPAITSALTLAIWSRWFRAMGAVPKVLHIPYDWFAYGVLAVMLIAATVGMAFPGAVADLMFNAGAETPS